MHPLLLCFSPLLNTIRSFSSSSANHSASVTARRSGLEQRSIHRLACRGVSPAPPEMASGLSHGTRRDVSIESMARPVAVDHRISIHYYFRIADNLLRQADVYREEKNVLDLYIILLRYSSLLLETIPKHRDYNAFKAREKDFLKKGLHNSEKILGVVNELESLKPVVQQQIATLNSRVADEPNGVYGTHVASSGLEHHTPGPYMSKSMAGSPTLLLQKPLPGSKHQAAPSQSIQPYRHAMKIFEDFISDTEKWILSSYQNQKYAVLTSNYVGGGVPPGVPICVAPRYRRAARSEHRAHGSRGSRAASVMYCVDAVV
ncbi:hypothetical protein U9M48_032382 [Paspalum notatum var. saurae]|uniref:USP8 dimerisation domain-containing protein n=1 Tax=Paspalum notatum var. saurae TaxID=547442 RepID=A0AAQ3U506_PASNO